MNYNAFTREFFPPSVVAAGRQFLSMQRKTEDTWTALINDPFTCSSRFRLVATATRVFAGNTGDSRRAQPKVAKVATPFVVDSPRPDQRVPHSVAKLKNRLHRQKEVVVLVVVVCVWCVCGGGGGGGGFSAYGLYFPPAIFHDNLEACFVFF